MSAFRRHAFWLVLAFTLLGVLAQDPDDEDEDVEEEESDESKETKALMEQLTISMVSEVVDEKSFIVRDASAKTGRRKTLIRLGNTATTEQGELSDDDHQAKLAKSKEALTKAIGKQMIWWKAADDEVQPKVPEGKKPEDTPIIGDVWLIDGRHINGWMKNEGYLAAVQEYESELARDIMSVESEKKKKEAYEELAQAMKESSEYKAKAKKEAKQKAQKAVEAAAAEKEASEASLGMGVWIGAAVLVVGVIAAALSFSSSDDTKKATSSKKKTKGS
eukprot:TRINITY_DN101423_c0_g1_i1.p1 TRINITY_DN101423_c0_g1~~TRINITY_DN101423_c0_g1_i1.p1  ORF type:complete len:276 (+),score=120.40 TRINITY_DN101423_c0_g1_i1:57-884(+)